MTDNPMIPRGSNLINLANETNVADEGRAAGAAFGEMIQSTGLAVAETQRRLNETAAATATALANTNVNVIALQERVYDANGNIVDGESHSFNLPLINFIDPVVYQWTRVRMQGVFYAREFSSSAEVDTSSLSISGGGSYGMVLAPIFSAGRGGLSTSVTTTSTDVDRDQDFSYGRMRMNALLEPRSDIGVPNPTQIIQGPNLSILQGEIQDVMDGDLLTGRTMSLAIQYRRATGEPIQAKLISIETEGAAWTFDGDPATDVDGITRITLRRQFLDEDADTTPADIIVSARIGLVFNNTTVTF